MSVKAPIPESSEWLLLGALVLAMAAACAWFVWWLMAALALLQLYLSPPDIEGHPTLADGWPDVAGCVAIGILAIPVFALALLCHSRVRLGPRDRRGGRGFPVVPDDSQGCRPRDGSQ